MSFLGIGGRNRLCMSVSGIWNRGARGSAEKELSCMSEISTAVKFEVSLYIYHVCTVESSFS